MPIRGLLQSETHRVTGRLTFGMQQSHDVVVVRYGHRPGRDDRMTTHVGLTARALGADRVVVPDNAGQSVETVRDITERFGGPFEIEQSDSLGALIRNFEGTVVHLTMYGLPVQDVERDVRSDLDEGPLMIVVGGEKVPFEIYEHADYNVGVTNQPHSEVAGLAVFLDRLFEGRELDTEWVDAENQVIPQSTGKKVIPGETDTDQHSDA